MSPQEAKFRRLATEKAGTAADEEEPKDKGSPDKDETDVGPEEDEADV